MKTEGFWNFQHDIHLSGNSTSNTHFNVQSSPFVPESYWDHSPSLWLWQVFCMHVFVFPPVSQSCPFIAATASLLCHSTGVVSCETVMSTFIPHTVTEPQVEIVHVLCEVLSLAVCWANSRSVVRCWALQETGNGNMKVREPRRECCVHRNKMDYVVIWYGCVCLDCWNGNHMPVPLAMHKPE